MNPFQMRRVAATEVFHVTGVGNCAARDKVASRAASYADFNELSEVLDFAERVARKDVFRVCGTCLRAVKKAAAQAPVEVPVHRPTADALDELIQLIEEVDAEKAVSSEASLKQRRERLAAELAEVDAQLAALASPAVDKDPITGWPVFTVGNARYAVGPRAWVLSGSVDWVRYFWVDETGNNGGHRRAYADSAAGTVQRQLWDARRDYDTDIKAAVQVDGVLYRVQAAKDSEGEPFLWYTAGGNGPRMSCNAYSPEGSIQRRIWDACNA